MPDGTDQLGSFLRARRARLTPAEVGLPQTRRRRTPGLRREEVAGLAGISTEWYVRIEQGRAVSPSPATVDALAAALRLTPGEHRHLKRLADPERRPAFERETVPEPLDRFIRTLDQPAYLVGRRWDLLAWNDAAGALFGDLFESGRNERNILLGMLTDPSARALFGDGWLDEARRMVALFRPTYDLWAQDAAFDDLLTRLRSGCTEFDALWSRHDFALPTSGIKALHRDGEEPRRYAYMSFQSNDDEAIKVCVYAAV